MLSLVVFIIVLGFVLSIDSFGVGFTYGMKSIRIPGRSLLIIMGITGAVIFISMSIGYSVKGFLYPNAAKIFGGMILIALGCWNLYNLSKTNHEEQIHICAETESVKKPIQLGDLIEILRIPMKADEDQSGWISGKEAVILGTALSLDAFGAGIGAAFLGYPLSLTPVIIAGMSGIFIYLGMVTGTLCSTFKWINQLRFLPGCLLIFIGLYKFL
jgi:putative sporulation protein YtaF